MLPRKKEPNKPKIKFAVITNKLLAAKDQLMQNLESILKRQYIMMKIMALTNQPMFLSYANQPFDLHNNPSDLFLYHGNIGH